MSIPGVAGVAMKLRIESLQNLCLRLKSTSGRKTFSHRAFKASLLSLSSECANVRLKSILQLPGSRKNLRQTASFLHCKSAICDLNSLRPTLRVGSIPLS